MESRKGLPKGLEFLGCLDVTLVLRDFQVLTGRIKGILGDRNYPDCCCANYGDDQHKKDEHEKDDCKKDDHNGDKCCKPKIDVKVEVEEDSKFILLELSRPAAAVSLSSVLCNLLGVPAVQNAQVLPGVINLVVTGTTFPFGTCVAINVDNIIYAGPSAEFCDVPICIRTSDSGTEISLEK